MSLAVILDVDGTLVEGGGRVGPVLVSALQEVRERHHAILASARPLFGVQPVKDEIGFDCAAIGFNGAIAYLPGSGVIARSPLDAQALTELWHTVRHLSEGSAVFVYTDEQWHGYGAPAAIAFEQQVVHTAPAMFSASFPTAPPEDITPVYKVTVVAPTIALWREHCDQLTSAGEDRWQTSRSSPQYTEVVARGISKATPLKGLRPALNISSIVAVGDGNNDLPLFAVADHAIAMAWAPPEVRAAASEIARSHSELATLLRALR